MRRVPEIDDPTSAIGRSWKSMFGVKAQSEAEEKMKAQEERREKKKAQEERRRE